MKMLINIIKPTVRTLILTVGLLLYASSMAAADELSSPLLNDSISSVERESLVPHKSLSLAFSHFTWGAEIGTSIDVTGYDLSTVDIDILFGYKNSFIRMAGFGAGIHRTVQGDDNFIPIYATIQTSFTRKPSICFMSAKIGYSFNTIGDSPTFGDTMASLGFGVSLSSTRFAKSYILASAGYRYFNRRHIEMISDIDRHYIFLAQLSFGVIF